MTNGDKPEMVIDDRTLLMSKARDKVCDLELLALALLNNSDGLNEAQTVKFEEVAFLYHEALRHIADVLEDIEATLTHIMPPAVVPKDADGPDDAEPSRA